MPKFTHRLPGDNQREREQQMQMKSKGIHRKKIPVWEPLATDQTDPWQVVHRQVFIKLIHGKLFPDRYLQHIPACWFQLRLLLSVALVVSGWTVWFIRFTLVVSPSSVYHFSIDVGGVGDLNSRGFSFGSVLWQYADMLDTAYRGVYFTFLMCKV